MDLLGVENDPTRRREVGKRLRAPMRALGWHGPHPMRIAGENGHAAGSSGYWRLPFRPRQPAVPVESDVGSDVESLADDLPDALERVTRLGLRKLERVLRTPLDVTDASLTRSQVTAAIGAVNAQLRADEQRLRAKASGDVLERLPALQCVRRQWLSSAQRSANRKREQQQRSSNPRLLWRKGLSMTSSQSIALATVFGLGLALAPVAWADSASDACAALVDARNALYSMINAKDKSAQDALNAKVQAASTKLDSVLAGMTGADAKLAADFKSIWDQFKATREKEIIPAIYKGNADDARKIADGIQSERLSKMWGIMSCKIR
jgi:hypothetical protein